MLEVSEDFNLANNIKRSLSQISQNDSEGGVPPDAEGCFQITAQGSGQRKYFEFRYSIRLHLDDKSALDYIQ